MVCVFRECPMCKHNLMWLPRYSPCPNCGYKQGPIQVPADPLLNTEEIIEEYGQASTDSETDALRVCALKSKPIRPKGRCSCCGKGICAYCRVHKLVENLISQAREKKESDHVMPKCTTDESKLYSTCECQTHKSFLAKVLSEMSMLLDVKPPHRPKQINISKKCDEIINATILKTHIAQKNAQKNRMKRFNEKSQSDDKNKSQKCKYERRKIVKPVEVVKKIVPANMGYLWTANEQGPRKPGYIDKNVKRIMHYFLNVHDTLTPEARRLAIEHVQKICNENEVVKPTLKVTKKNNNYYICLNSQTQDPTKRVVYKVAKYPYLEQYSIMKRQFKEKGYKKCVCHKPVANCICRDRHERKQLVHEVREYCCKLNMPPCHEDFVLSDTSMSEADLEFEVTSPDACMKSAAAKKPLYVNQGSQYNKGDLEPPKQLKQAKIAYKFFASYDCAVGRKYGEQVYRPQPNEVLPATDWLEYIKESKRKAKAAKKKKSLKPGQIDRLKPKPVHESGPPFGEKGPPKIARDGTALDKNDKPLVDADGNAYEVSKTIDGRLKVKPKKKGLNMIKYLIGKGLIVKKQTGRNPPKLPPGGISPEYLAKERELRNKRYQELFEQSPGILCNIDRLGRSYPCGGWRQYVC